MKLRVWKEHEIGQDFEHVTKYSIRHGVLVIETADGVCMTYAAHAWDTVYCKENHINDADQEAR